MIHGFYGRGIDDELTEAAILVSGNIDNAAELLQTTPDMLRGRVESADYQRKSGFTQEKIERPDFK